MMTNEASTDPAQAEPEFLSVKDAAEYIGVAAQTLRRWDEAGKLRPIRHAVNGYRYYRRAELEPFRLQYRQAQQAVNKADQIFKTLASDIEGNDQLREPQREAHKSVRTHFESSSEHAIVQIPVGCGKTGVIATLPFGISNGRVLVITPNLMIRKGVAEALDVASPKNFWRKTGALRDFSSGPYRTVLDGLDANLHDCNEADFVVTNIHQLASSADRWLPQFPPDYFDMVIVDEGHHNVAASWTKVFSRFSKAKVISLTATPFRGDGVRPVGKVIYKYPFTRAMVKGYIKQIHSRNVAPTELSFTYRDDTRVHTLDEVMALREEAWFRKGVALSVECNTHIVEASIKYLRDMRARTGFHHQLIAVACSIDHARQIRSLYAERGLTAGEIYSELDDEKKDSVIAELKRGKLDCIVQVQMLGEGFDHPPLSVAAIFRPYRSLSPYIQFVGRVMRVVHEDKPGHDDNHAYLVSHVGLSNDAHWDDFKELDFDDQQMIHKWVEGQPEGDGDGAGGGQPRRFDGGMLVNNEIIGEFIGQSYLDPDDDRVLKELLDRDIGGGLRVRDLIDKEALRATLKQKQMDASDGAPLSMPVQPQERRQQARKRLDERSKAVAARVLKDLKFSPTGREVGGAVKEVAGRDNRTASIELIHKYVNDYLGIDKNQRATLSLEQAEKCLAELDSIGDAVISAIKKGRS